MSVLFSLSGTVKEEYLSEVVFYHGLFSHFTHQHIFYNQESPPEHIGKTSRPVGQSLLVRPLFCVLLNMLVVRFSDIDWGQRICKRFDLNGVPNGI
jgi:hypothetical protein